MTPETAFLVGSVCAAVALCAACNILMRRFFRAERDAEIRAAYKRSSLFTRQWLRGETDQLPEVVED